MEQLAEPRPRGQRGERGGGAVAQPRPAPEAPDARRLGLERRPARRTPRVRGRSARASARLARPRKTRTVGRRRLFGRGPEGGRAVRRTGAIRVRRGIQRRAHRRGHPLGRTEGRRDDAMRAQALERGVRARSRSRLVRIGGASKPRVGSVGRTPLEQDGPFVSRRVTGVERAVLAPRRRPAVPRPPRDRQRPVARRVRRRAAGASDRSVESVEASRPGDAVGEASELARRAPHLRRRLRRPREPRQPLRRRPRGVCVEARRALGDALRDEVHLFSGLISRLALGR